MGKNVKVRPGLDVTGKKCTWEQKRWALRGDEKFEAITMSDEGGPSKEKPP